MINLYLKKEMYWIVKKFIFLLNMLFKISFGILFSPSSLQMYIHCYLCFFWQLKYKPLIRHKSDFIGSSPQTANLESWFSAKGVGVSVDLYWGLQENY